MINQETQEHIVAQRALRKLNLSQLREERPELFGEVDLEDWLRKLIATRPLLPANYPEILESNAEILKFLRGG